jgi:hypothetical protein
MRRTARFGAYNHLVAVSPHVIRHCPDAAERDGAPLEAHEWGEFAHKPGRKFFNFDEVRLEIVRETERSGASRPFIRRAAAAAAAAMGRDVVRFRVQCRLCAPSPVPPAVCSAPSAAGKNKGILPDPIGLRIFSYRVPDLFIVDTPGITKVGAPRAETLRPSRNRGGRQSRRRSSSR